MRLYGRIVRGCAAFALVCGGVVLGGVATQGCGGDDSNGGTNGDSGGGTSADGGIGIVAQNVSAYVGRVAQVDASQSTRPDGTSPLAFTWTLTGQPPTSKLSTADIQGANTETPSITPDVAGAFTLHAEATTGGVTGTADVTVTGVNGDVYFVLVNAKDTPTTAQIETVQMDGTNEHALNCKRTLFPGSLLGDAGTLDGFSLDAGDAGGFQSFVLPTLFAGLMGPFVDVSLDTWESPVAGQPSRVAFGDFATALGEGDAGSIALVAATTDNTCQKPPHPLHAVVAQGSAPNVWQPRFSPDGSRIAYVEDRGAAPDAGFIASDTYEYISTVGFDGSDSHTVATYCPVVTDGCWGQHLFPRRPQWQDPTHIAWIRGASGTNSGQHPISWEIVSAEDAENSTPTRVMSCTSYNVPYSFGFATGPNLPAGAILANFQPSATAAEDLVILAPDPTGQCQVVTNLTNLPGGAKESYARDFAISPDGTTVAFMMHSQDRQDAGTEAPLTDGGPQINFNVVTSGGGNIWLVPIDGSQPAAPLNASPNYAFFGPRFISGGTRLAWNGQGPLPPDVLAELEAGLADAGATGDASPLGALGNGYLGGQPAMVVAPVAGGNVTFVASTDNAAGTFPLGGGNGGGCQCDPECGLVCPSNGNCSNNVAGRHPELPLTTTAAIAAVLVIRRRTRKKKDGAKKDDSAQT